MPATVAATPTANTHARPTTSYRGLCSRPPAIPREHHGLLFPISAPPRGQLARPQPQLYERLARLFRQACSRHENVAPETRERRRKSTPTDRQRSRFLTTEDSYKLDAETFRK